MFNPLTLRLCCLATMAPALTSEAATRARETLQRAQTSPEIPLLNGRLHSQISMSNTVKGSNDSAPHPKSTSINRTAQVVNISKDLQKRRTEGGQLIADAKSAQQVKGQSVVNLGSISNLSELYRQQHLEVFGKTSTVQGNKVASTPRTVLPNSSPASGNGTVHTTSNGTVLMTGSTSLHSALLKSNQPISSTSVISAMHQTASTSSVASSSIRKVPGNKLVKIPCTKSSAISSTSQLSTGSSNKTSGMTNGISTTSRQPAKPSTIPTTSTIVSATKSPPSSSQDAVNIKITSHAQSSTPQMIDSVARRQKMLETRAERLLRRLRRLQSRQAISHTKQQLSQFVEQQRQTLPTYGKNTNLDFQTELLHSKSMSTAALVELVHKMQSTQSTLRQQLAAYEPDEPTKLGEDRCAELDRVSGHLKCNMGHLRTMLDSDATESSSGGESCDEFDYDDDWDGKIPRPPISCRSEWHWSSDRAAVASRWTWLQAQVSDLEYRIRQQYDIYKQIRANKGNVVLGEPPPPVDLMAQSKAEKASRKLTPLEEKIANLQAKTEVSPANISTLLSNVDKQSSQLANQMGPLYTPHQSPGSCASSTSNSTVATPKTPSVLNGFVDNVNKTSDDLGKVTNSGPDTSMDHTFQAARCRPVKSYRKRKLLRTSGLHHMNRKAARLSTVMCHCYPPVSSCSMCGGRYNNVMQMDATTMPYMERVALVDISYHPVLSFPQDVGLSTQCESMLKTGEWQQKPTPRTYRMVQPDRKRLKVKEGVRKYQRRLKKNTSATILSSTKIRNKYEQKQMTRNLVNSPVKAAVIGNEKKLSRAELRLRKRKVRESLRQFNKRMGGTVHRESPLSASTQSQMWKELKDGARKKRTENAYDIDNIVIPYSIAASTRVEKLQYKEIITPKWREIGAKNSAEEAEALVPEAIPKWETPVVSPLIPDVKPVLEDIPLVCEGALQENEDSEEDLCEDTYRQRHLRCEILEKKRFSAALSTSSNNQRRSRGAQRADSTASAASVSNLDTSVLDLVQSECNNTVTPPDTPVVPSPLPIPVLEELDEITRKSLQEATRRRSSSVSSSKSTHSRCPSHCDDQQLSNVIDKPIVNPWIKRTFPLTADDLCELYKEPSVQNKNRISEKSSVKVIAQEMVIRENTVSSPMPGDNSDTSSDIIEDLDDPEWTVISERQQQPKQANLVLKLAKR